MIQTRDCIELNSLCYLFQFQDSKARTLERKKGFEVVFLIHAVLPLLLSSITIITYNYAGGMDVVMGFDIVAYFSPLTNWDVFIVYTFQASSFIMPLILHKSYKKMEKPLAQFSQHYIESMHGILSKGILPIPSISRVSGKLISSLHMSFRRH